jgi:hypothetical protein
MAQAPACLLASAHGRNPAPEAAALHHEWSAALCIWAALSAGSRKRTKVCRELLELRGRHDASAASLIEEVAHA